jgi:hypothetical protein
MDRTTGLIKNGVILPDIPIHAREGERVLITFLTEHDDEPTSASAPGDLPLASQSVDRVEYIPPSESLTVLLANVIHEAPIDAAAWNAEWARIEAEMNERDQADDQHESMR